MTYDHGVALSFTFTITEIPPAVQYHFRDVKKHKLEQRLKIFYVPPHRLSQLWRWREGPQCVLTFGAPHLDSILIRALMEWDWSVFLRAKCPNWTTNGEWAAKRVDSYSGMKANGSSYALRVGVPFVHCCSIWGEVCPLFWTEYLDLEYVCMYTMYWCEVHLVGRFPCFNYL